MTGTMHKDVHLAGTQLKLWTGQNVILTPATNQPDKTLFFAAPIDGSFGEDSILLNHGDCRVHSAQESAQVLTEWTK